MNTTFICEKCGNTTYDQMTYTQARCLKCNYLGLFDSGFKGQREFQLSPDKDLLNVEPIIKTVTAPLIKRFVNYIVDLILVSIFMAVVLSFTNMDITNYKSMMENKSFQLIIFGCMILYYTIFEFAFGKTLGKFFTKTKVVSTDGQALTFWQCLFRSILRVLIPFEFLTGLFLKGIFWHDSLPKTMVVEEN